MPKHVFHTRGHLLDPETWFCFDRCLPLGPEGSFSGSQPGHCTSGRSASQVAGDRPLSFLGPGHQCPCLFPKEGCVRDSKRVEIPSPTGTVRVGKNKHGKTFQGNRGKLRTKESGEKGSSCAKGKQMEETLKPPGTQSLR